MQAMQMQWTTKPKEPVVIFHGDGTRTEYSVDSNGAVHIGPQYVKTANDVPAITFKADPNTSRGFYVSPTTHYSMSLGSHMMCSPPPPPEPRSELALVGFVFGLVSYYVIRRLWLWSSNDTLPLREGTGESALHD